MEILHSVARLRGYRGNNPLDYEILFDAPSYKHEWTETTKLMDTLLPKMRGLNMEERTESQVNRKARTEAIVRHVMQKNKCSEEEALNRMERVKIKRVKWNKQHLRGAIAQMRLTCTRTERHAGRFGRMWEQS